MLIRACGDVVQAMQALKESRPSRTEELQRGLLELQRALLTCDTYSLEKGLSRPFTRARVQVTDAYSWFFPNKALLDIPEYHVGPQISNWDNPRPNAGTIATSLYTSLGTMKIPRLFNGLWQLSSPAWGSATSKQQNAALGRLVEAGLVATDMADHYVRKSIFYQYKTAYNAALYHRETLNLYMDYFVQACHQRSLPRSLLLPNGVSFDNLKSIYHVNSSWKLFKNDQDGSEDESNCCNSIGMM